MFECNFNHVLGFGPRNQNVGRNLEIQAPEFLMAGEVLRRDPARSPSDQRKILLTRRGVDFLFRMCVEPCAVAPERVQQQQFCGQRWRWHVLALELRDRVTEGGADVPDWLVLSGSEA